MRSDTRLMRYGPLMRCNTATPGSSTLRTSDHSVRDRIFLTFFLAELISEVTWGDNARDVLNFILHFLPEEATPLVLPTNLPRVPLETSEARKRLGLARRKLVVVGHSLGGCSACVLFTPSWLCTDLPS
jgi:hypothetical protein